MSQLDSPVDLYAAYCKVLENDPRPTCIIDTEANRAVISNRNKLSFCNTAIRQRPDLVRDVETTSLNIHSISQILSNLGHGWTCFNVLNRWLVISLNSAKAVDDVTGTLYSSKELQNGHDDVFDIPTIKVSHVIKSRIKGETEMANFIRIHDWSKHDLGPIESWPERLVILLNLALADTQPTVLFWGKELYVLYNDSAAASLTADRHPRILGVSIVDAYSDVPDTVAFTLSVRNSGKPATVETAPVLKQGDSARQVFVELIFAPVVDDDGTTCGIYERINDISRETLHRRRAKTSTVISEATRLVTSVGGIWSILVDVALAKNSDFQQVLVYSVNSRTAAADAILSPLQAKECVLERSFGFTSSPSTPNFEHFNLLETSSGLAGVFREASSLERPLYQHRTTSKLPVEFWDALRDCTPGGKPQHLAIFPIRPTRAADVSAFFVIGLDAVQPYDVIYQDFVQLIQRQMAACMSATLLLEEEIGSHRAAVERGRVALEERTIEAQHLEARFSMLAKHIPVGLGWLESGGGLQYGNDLYYDMLGLERGSHPDGTAWWYDVVDLSASGVAEEIADTVFVKRESMTKELQALQRNPIPGTSQEERWLLVSLHPDNSTNPAPDTKGMLACMTDISAIKKAEKALKRRVDEVVDSQRQQENFIDITCHEIRNPLSVVLQCGDELIEALGQLLHDIHTDTGTVVAPTALIKSLLDAAETIEYCTLHQKRIIDDILTLSKMEAGLLPLSTEETRIVDILESTMKIYQREMRISEIAVDMQIHDSIFVHNVESAELDGGRFSQIIINLVSNAVKFTKSQSRRAIGISITASTSREDPLSCITYMPVLSAGRDRTSQWSWTDSSTVFVHFAVKDTGGGMTTDEQTALFKRFSQVPKTSSTYGGSGLGLYISRALAEMHGGQIGFSSALGRGSTFGFYVKVLPVITIPVSPNPATLSLGLNPLPSAPPSNDTPIARRSAGLSPGLVETQFEFEGIPGQQEEDALLSILVVEDNELNQRVLRRQLEKLGHSVTVANHGQEALDILQQTRHWATNPESCKSFSAVLLDQEMPVLDGTSTARIIRRQESDGIMVGHLPLIAITGNARGEKVDQLRAAGMVSPKLEFFP